MLLQTLLVHVPYTLDQLAQAMEEEEAGDQSTGRDAGEDDGHDQPSEKIEFFDDGGSGGESDEREGSSPEQASRGKDSDSTRGAFVTLSPSISPGMNSALETIKDLLHVHVHVKQ